MYTFVLTANMPEGPQDLLLCYESLAEDDFLSIEGLAALFDEIRRLTDLLE